MDEKKENQELEKKVNELTTQFNELIEKNNILNQALNRRILLKEGLIVINAFAALVLIFGVPYCYFRYHTPPGSYFIGVVGLIWLLLVNIWATEHAAGK